MVGRGLLLRLGLSGAVTIASAIARAAPPTSSVLSDLDLFGPFSTRSPWRLTAVQGPPADDPLVSGGERLPGAITLCLRSDAAGPCDPQLTGTPSDQGADGPMSEAHYLREVRVVHPRGSAGRPLLLVATAGLYSGDGDQIRFTQLFAYRRDRNRFAPVFGGWTGRNNNQEIRYVDAGRLRGDVISAEPTGDAPFGFWITVHAPVAGGGYARVLRYRSATGYEDGNPLPVIDSEMPSIQRRLGLWRPGAPLPLPDGPCPRPHLKGAELWCD